MLILISLSIWLIIEFIFFISHLKPLNDAEISKLSQKRTRKYIKKIILLIMFLFPEDAVLRKYSFREVLPYQEFLIHLMLVHDPLHHMDICPYASQK